MSDHPKEFRRERSAVELAQRIPILSTCTYMISNSLGAMPRAVYNTLHEFADTWATLGVSAWGKPYGSNPTWWEVKGAVGDKIAPLMGAPAGSVLVHENASIANGILMSALDWSDTRRSKIVVSDMDFPSDVYSIQRMLPPHISVQVIRTRDGITLPIDGSLDAIDEETRLVSLSHVLFRSATSCQRPRSSPKAHAVGAQVLLNGYHSVGIIPVDVTAMNVDYYIGGTLKWMCGGPGGVFLYVRPDLLTTLQPKITGWFAHKNPFAFDIDHFELARRLLPPRQRHAGDRRAVRDPARCGRDHAGWRRGHPRQVAAPDSTAVRSRGRRRIRNAHAAHRGRPRRHGDGQSAARV
ncbi:MAG: aminotransferase class V-fold PLP-dependent enzyme [Chloroflexi bacterium]|nr:aminotransferase class V-fold PLP-dependent enzyme [Chloroflexota bacterium]